MITSHNSSVRSSIDYLFYRSGRKSPATGRNTKRQYFRTLDGIISARKGDDSSFQEQRPDKSNTRGLPPPPPPPPPHPLSRSLRSNSAKILPSSSGVSLYLFTATQLAEAIYRRSTAGETSGIERGAGREHGYRARCKRVLIETEAPKVKYRAARTKSFRCYYSENVNTGDDPTG